MLTKESIEEIKKYYKSRISDDTRDDLFKRYNILYEGDSEARKDKHQKKYESVKQSREKKLEDLNKIYGNICRFNSRTNADYAHGTNLDTILNALINSKSCIIPGKMQSKMGIKTLVGESSAMTKLNINYVSSVTLGTTSSSLDDVSDYAQAAAKNNSYKNNESSIIEKIKSIPAIAIGVGERE